MKIYFKLKDYEYHNFYNHKLAICVDIFETWIAFKYRKLVAKNVEMEYVSDWGKIENGKRNKYEFTWFTLARINWKNIKKGSFFWRYSRGKSNGPVN